MTRSRSSLKQFSKHINANSKVLKAVTKLIITFTRLMDGWSTMLWLVGCNIDRTCTVGHFWNQKFAKILTIPGKKKSIYGIKASVGGKKSSQFVKIFRKYSDSLLNVIVTPTALAWNGLRTYIFLHLIVSKWITVLWYRYNSSGIEVNKFEKCAQATITPDAILYILTVFRTVVRNSDNQSKLSWMAAASIS